MLIAEIFEESVQLGVRGWTEFGDRAYGYIVLAMWDLYRKFEESRDYQ